MCEYNTHVKSCPICIGQETILISENPCKDAGASGRFGSCGKTDNKIIETVTKCWKCKEDGQTQRGKNDDDHRMRRI